MRVIFPAYFHSMCFAAAACLAMSGCSSSQNPSTSGLGSQPDYTWGVTVTNKLDKTVWVTRYWSYGWQATWHIEGASCFARGESKTIYTGWWSNAYPEAKLRFEVKSGPNCGGDTVTNGDFYGPKCSLTFNGSTYIGGSSEVYADNGFNVKQSCGQ